MLQKIKDWIFGEKDLSSLSSCRVASHGASCSGHDLTIRAWCPSPNPAHVLGELTPPEMD